MVFGKIVNNTLRFWHMLKGSSLKKIDIGYGYAYYYKEFIVSSKDLIINIRSKSGIEKKYIKETPHYGFICEYLNDYKLLDVDDYGQYKETFFKGIDVGKQIANFKLLAEHIRRDLINDKLNVFDNGKKREEFYEEK